MINDEQKLIFLDTETTGVEEADRLCQVAYLNGEMRQSLFKPPVPMTVDAMSVNHITDEHVADCKPFKDSAEFAELQSFFNKDYILIAHNADFDMRFLLKEGMVLPKRFICTMKVAHHFDKECALGKHNLQYLRYFYKLKFEQKINSHEAVADVIVLNKLFEFYSNHYSIQEMVEISAQPILFKKMTFGKYKDRFFKDIARADLDYLLWARRSMTLDDNMRYTLEYYIKNR